VLLQLIPDHHDPTVVVVGDTHGQYHDVCEMCVGYGLSLKSVVLYV
jgi:hypothetical protein